MSLKKSLLALLMVPLALGGCSVVSNSSSGGTPGTSASAGPVSGSGWIVSAQGSATASPGASHTGTPAPALPPVKFLAAGSSCAKFARIDAVLIPLTVTPGKGTLKITWPQEFASNYRVAAVAQPLVSGPQKPEVWQNVAPAAGCTVTTTITGLKSGVPYIVWLDAPNTGSERDGTRHPYSGRSGVVYPL
jgi:hypothetical protein